MTSITGTLHDDICIFMIISHWILLRMRNVSDKVDEKIKSDISYSVTFFENCVTYKIVWKNMVEPGRSQTMIKYGACTLHAG